MNKINKKSNIFRICMPVAHPILLIKNKMLFLIKEFLYNLCRVKEVHYRVCKPAILLHSIILKSSVFYVVSLLIGSSFVSDRSNACSGKLGTDVVHTLSNEMERLTMSGDVTCRPEKIDGVTCQPEEGDVDCCRPEKMDVDSCQQEEGDGDDCSEITVENELTADNKSNIDADSIDYDTCSDSSTSDVSDFRKASVGFMSGFKTNSPTKSFSLFGTAFSKNSLNQSKLKNDYLVPNNSPGSDLGVKGKKCDEIGATNLSLYHVLNHARLKNGQTDISVMDITLPDVNEDLPFSLKQPPSCEESTAMEDSVSDNSSSDSPVQSGYPEYSNIYVPADRYPVLPSHPLLSTDFLQTIVDKSTGLPVVWPKEKQDRIAFLLFHHPVFAFLGRCSVNTLAADASGCIAIPYDEALPYEHNMDRQYAQLSEVLLTAKAGDVVFFDFDGVLSNEYEPIKKKRGPFDTRIYALFRTVKRNTDATYILSRGDMFDSDPDWHRTGLSGTTIHPNFFKYKYTEGEMLKFETVAGLGTVKLQRSLGVDCYTQCYTTEETISYLECIPNKSPDEDDLLMRLYPDQGAFRVCKIPTVKRYKNRTNRPIESDPYYDDLIRNLLTQSESNMPVEESVFMDAFQAWQRVKRDSRISLADLIHCYASCQIKGYMLKPILGLLKSTKFLNKTINNVYFVDDQEDVCKAFLHHALRLKDEGYIRGEIKVLNLL